MAPLRRENKDEIYGVVGVFHDVTELKRAEQIRIDFVANVSHELRTPLTSIKGFTDTLKADVESGRMQDVPKFLATITRNVDRLMALINDLLDLSSMESGIDWVRQPLHIPEILERVMVQVEGLKSSKKHQIVVEVQDGLDTVMAAPGRVEQVLTNLLENAIKYCPAESTIRVIWERKKDTVRLRVVDNGPGIPAEHQTRLFERFYRIDKARSREMGGTGLGLAIVKHIMQAHGGTVYVASEPGRGAEFGCVFPA